VIYTELANKLNDLTWYMQLWAARRYWGVRKEIQNIDGLLIGHYFPYYMEAEKWTKQA
jgi:hypothetical protein